MAYVKQVWSDRQVERPLTFNSSTNADGSITLSPAPGKVTQAGTLITADRMNHIENGISGVDSSLSNLSVQVKNSKKKGDFVVLSGTVTVTASGTSGAFDGIGSTNISYPSGFTKDNCVIVSIATGLPANGWYATGSVPKFRTIDIQKGMYPSYASLTANNIQFQVFNGYTQGATLNYKIVLMKIS